MKPRKLSKTLLAAVLMLSLLVSVFPGFGIVSSADTTTWDHTYEVIPNTESSVAYVDQTNMKDDFKVYRWTHPTQDGKSVYSVSTLDTGYENGVDMSAADLRNPNANYTVDSVKNTDKSGTLTCNDKGYLNFNMEFWKTWALTNEKYTVDDNFEMEVTLVGTARVGFRNIVISKNKGAMSLATGTATDLIIGLSDDQNYGTRFLVGGAVASASATGTSANGNTTQSYSIGADTNITKFSYRIGATSNNDDTGVKGFGKATDKTKTFHIKVKDGVLQIWDIEAPDSYMSVVLTDAFTGGYVSFVGANADYTSDTTFSVDEGMALASMKWKDILSTEEEEAAAEAAFQARTEFEYAVTKSTANEDVESDFMLNRWAFTRSSGLISAAPVAQEGFPKAIVTGTTMQVGNNSHGQYYGFKRIGESSDATTALWWSTSGTYDGTSYLNALTHKRVLQANDEFYLEMSMWNKDIADADRPTYNSIMIAPAGEFAVQKNTSNTTAADKGIFVSINDNLFTSVAGAIDSSTVSNQSVSNNTNKASGQKHTVNRSVPNGYEVAAQEILGTASADGSLITYCVELKNGVLSVWNKDDARKVIKVEVNNDYVGGNISWVGSDFNNGGFAGMELTVNPAAEAKETYKFETTSDGLLGADVAAGKYAASNISYVELDNGNLTERQIADYDAYIDGNYDLYYTLNGKTVKQDAIRGNDAGWNMAAGIINRHVGTFTRIQHVSTGDKAGYGALVPTMETMNSDESASLFASDVKVRTGFYFDNSSEVQNQTGMLGLRMAKVGDFTSDGVYVKATHSSVVLVDGETETTLADYSDLTATVKVLVKLDLALVGTALTGTVTVGERDYTVGETVSYDEAGFLAIGATGNKLDLDLMDVELVDYAKAEADDDLGEGALNIKRVDTDLVGYYKYVITTVPNPGAALKAGTLVSTDAERPVPKRVGFQSDDTQGTDYVVYSKSDVTVKATFYTVTAGDENIAKVGVSANTTPEGEEGWCDGGLRFVYHAGIHKNAADKYVMTVDGVEKEVADFGAIVATEATANALEGGLCYENKDADYVQYRSVKDSGIYYDLCDTYAQFAIQVINIEYYSAQNTNLTACGYIVFTDGTVVSTEAFTTNYAAEQ